MDPQKKKEHLWNFHPNDKGVQDKIKLQYKAREFYKSKIRTEFLPRLDERKHLEIELRRMKLDHYSYESVKPI